MELNSSFLTCSHILCGPSEVVATWHLIERSFSYNGDDGGEKSIFSQVFMSSTQLVVSNSFHDVKWTWASKKSTKIWKQHIQAKGVIFFHYQILRLVTLSSPSLSWLRLKSDLLLLLTLTRTSSAITLWLWLVQGRTYKSTIRTELRMGDSPKKWSPALQWANSYTMQEGSKLIGIFWHTRLNEH